MCKRRVKVLNAKSPATHGAKTPQKAYKHIEMLQLNCIKRVVNINDTKGKHKLKHNVIPVETKYPKLLYG